MYAVECFNKNGDLHMVRKNMGSLSAATRKANEYGRQLPGGHAKIWAGEPNTGDMLKEIKYTEV